MLCRKDKYFLEASKVQFNWFPGIPREAPRCLNSFLFRRCQPSVGFAKSPNDLQWVVAGAVHSRTNPASFDFSVRDWDGCIQAGNHRSEYILLGVVHSYLEVVLDLLVCLPFFVPLWVDLVMRPEVLAPCPWRWASQHEYCWVLNHSPVSFVP